MPHRYLIKLASVLQLYQCRKETVHAGKERNTLCIVGMKDFQRTARIGRSVVRHHTAEGVGYLGLHPLERRILAPGTNPHHQGILRSILQ